MTEQNRYQDLVAYVDSLSEEERAKQAAKGQAHSQAAFNLLKSGDRVGLYCAVQNNPKLLDKQDGNGMTLLHHAGLDKSGLTQEILTHTPNAAPWTRDSFDRLPLDVMQSSGADLQSAKLERLTYSTLFKDEKDGPVKPEQLKDYAKEYQALGRPETTPKLAQDFTPKQMYPKLRAQERSADKDQGPQR